MNFLILRNFLEFFRIYLNLFLILKECFFLSLADVAKLRHMAARVHTTWRRTVCVCVFARVSMCVLVCAYVDYL